jgi:8-oxo-dGTP pyrophosphatase MutT (NUDIX family)
MKDEQHRTAGAGTAAAPSSDMIAIDDVRRRLGSHRYRPITDDEAAIRFAVLIPFYLLRGEVHVVLTKRTTLMRRNQGHVSFPGGRREDDDPDLLATALRESDEEIGLAPAHVEVIGRVDDFSTRDGELFIAGFAGLIDPAATPYAWRPAETEVAEILEVPLRHLLDPANVVVAEPRELNGRLWPNETFCFGGHRIFGATARTLRHVLDLLFPKSS